MENKIYVTHNVYIKGSVAYFILNNNKGSFNTND